MEFSVEPGFAREVELALELVSESDWACPRVARERVPSTAVRGDSLMVCAVRWQMSGDVVGAVCFVEDWIP